MQIYRTGFGRKAAHLLALVTSGEGSGIAFCSILLSFPPTLLVLPSLLSTFLPSFTPLEATFDSPGFPHTSSTFLLIRPVDIH